MSRLVEEFPLEDVSPDLFESTVGDTTDGVGGTPAETDFGGGQIQTPADRVRRRGSVGWEGNDITEEEKRYYRRSYSTSRRTS